jgi:signal transduction histidine kinase
LSAEVTLPHERRFERREERAAKLAVLERDVLAHLAERTPTGALEELAAGLERIADPGTLVSILVADERDARFLRHGAAPSLPEGFISALGLVPIARDAGSCGTAAFRKEPVVVTDIATDPLWSGFRSLAAAHELRSCWSVPVFASDGTLLGTFAFYHREPRKPSAEDLASIEDAARLARIVLERQRAELAQLRSSRRKRALFAAASVLATADDLLPRQALENVLAAVAEALDWDAGAVWSQTADHGALACSALWARKESALAAFVADTHDRRYAHGDGLPGRVLASGEATWHSIVDDDPTFPRWPSARAAGLTEGFAVPIVEGTTTIGAMELFTSRPEPADPDLLLALRTVGLQIGQFLRRVRLGEELRETVRFGELFSAILAHDLRNPLNTVVMGTEILAGAVSDDRALRTVERMRSAESRMTRMIEQLLDLTRSRSGGGIAIARAPADLTDLARAMVNELVVGHPERRIELTCAGDGRGHWDHDRLAQVLSNLLGNALVHGEAGGVVAMRIDGGESASVRIETHNLGTVPSELLPVLFDPFRRATTTKAPARGLGLGLYITKLLVEAHGGTVDVSSSADLGTRFGVTLPRGT